jgi:hypothetical protein
MQKTPVHRLGCPINYTIAAALMHNRHTKAGQGIHEGERTPKQISRWLNHA